MHPTDRLLPRDAIRKHPVQLRKGVEELTCALHRMVLSTLVVTMSTYERHGLKARDAHTYKMF